MQKTFLSPSPLRDTVLNLVPKIRLTHVISHVHLCAGLLEGLHVPGDLLRVHQLVHATHGLGRGAHRAGQRYVRAHRLVVDLYA